ncbi:50S ribosomal protein L9 [Helicobacter ailurogastricus]|uniref:Large ribosomal subunit protein bL9 n=1 Tax=Helicobacter ailurogastricus TaxID=1578720 RepID=A0A0K2X9S7_9HELI|nr:50S ribosomal protein L9 [Helicobacter ailurogastricus]CRF41464.1 LSU ribosomal protein L9p [Helicobacter ailurogastricus]CRF43238.1 LSU ribosomal protein L9p [Helicobacter ailurogastricus]CRF43543.1 LSU ribosomal protein L9p [Helicobacter ailurogastricus]CRF52757.1 LSU ribosomal protein L9p [Helicobacter ailurogastricus]BDQ28219.1 50S ribosomal protein L9 [Helicobacter ailurogastricus]
MQVLLLKDVKNLGKAGEVVRVKDGYGNNFLLAKGLAKLATSDVIRQFKAHAHKRAEQEAKDLADKQELAQKLEAITLKITKKVGANGALFGSITKEEVIEALHASHPIELDKKTLELKTPIKSTGIYEIEVKLGHGVHGVLKVDVVAE